MTDESTVTPRRRAARAILIDDDGRLVLIKRTKPGRAAYWTAPGGGIEETDASPEAALHRELAEELGAEAMIGSQVMVLSSPLEAGVSVQHIFAARLTSLDESARHGPELDDPSRGGYEIERVDLLGDDLASVDLKPTALKEFILANRDTLIRSAGLGELAFGDGDLVLRPETGSPRRRIVVTRHEIAVLGWIIRRRRQRSRAVRLVRAILPWRGLITVDTVFVLDADGKVVIRIYLNGYNPSDINRLIEFLGLPCSGPGRPVTYNQLNTMYPGLVRGYEAHPFRFALWGVIFVLVAASIASVLLAV